MTDKLKTLQMSKEGFYIDEAFIERIKKKVSKGRKEHIDQLLCATVIAEFMATFEVTVH